MKLETTPAATFPVSQLRGSFLRCRGRIDGQVPIYLDGPAGSQVPQCVADAVSRYLTTTNANHGGVFATSRTSDALLDEAHAALADFVGSDDPQTIAFGANMTTLTLGLSRALGRTLRPGDEVIVSRLDHDANVTPWVLAARDAGARVLHIDIHPQDCTLNLADLRQTLAAHAPGGRGAASNAVGTINPVAEIAKRVHAVGALVCRCRALRPAPLDRRPGLGLRFPGLFSVQVLWSACRRAVGQARTADRTAGVQAASRRRRLAGRWMTGTQNHEGIAGALAAVGSICRGSAQLIAGETAERRTALDAAFESIAAYETELCRELLSGLKKIPGVKIWGITDESRLDQRVPTVAITHERLSPLELAEHLGRSRNLRLAWQLLCSAVHRGPGVGTRGPGEDWLAALQPARRSAAAVGSTEALADSASS